MPGFSLVPEKYTHLNKSFFFVLPLCKISTKREVLIPFVYKYLLKINI